MDKLLKKMNLYDEETAMKKPAVTKRDLLLGGVVIVLSLLICSIPM